MKIVCLIPTRGRKVVWKTAREMMEHATLADTRIVVGLDADDRVDPVFDSTKGMRQTISSISEREDTLGAKLNRMWLDAPGADLYVYGHDSMPYLDHGWDEKLAAIASLFEQTPGYIGIGPNRGTLNNFGAYAMTASFINAVGYFAPSGFPFWWVDTWVNEIAILAGVRVLVCPLQIGDYRPQPPKTNGLREVMFWATAFDRLRPERIAAARDVIFKADDLKWRQVQAELNLEFLSGILSSREAHMRHPQGAQRLEAQWGVADQPPDARYWRVKDAMVKRLAALEQRG